MIVLRDSLGPDLFGWWLLLGFTGRCGAFAFLVGGGSSAFVGQPLPRQGI